MRLGFFGSGTSVWVCEPRQVCTAATCFGLRMSLMSKMRMPRNRSLLTVSLTPCRPQSSRPRVCSTDMKRRCPHTETSPWPPGQATEVIRRGLAGVLDVVDVEAVVVADDDVGAEEGEVGIGEAAAPRRRGRRRAGRRLRLGRRAGRALGRRHGARRGLRIEEALGLWKVGHELHAARGRAGVAEPGLEADSRVLGIGRRLLRPDRTSQQATAKATTPADNTRLSFIGRVSSGTGN